MFLYEVRQEPTNLNESLLAKCLLTGKGRATQDLIRSDINHPYPVPLLSPLTQRCYSPHHQNYVCFKSEHGLATNSIYALSELVANTCPPPCCLWPSATCLADQTWQPARFFLRLSVSGPSCSLPVWKSCPKTLLHELPPTRQREGRRKLGTLVSKGCQSVM